MNALISKVAVRVLIIVGVALPVGALGQSSENDFGVVTFFKKYPEFKRGFDPYANLSGTVQENVDLYSGKLNLAFQLPGIPWSETATFAPVLTYSSNIWSYTNPSSGRHLIGGEITRDDPPPNEPPDEVIGKIPTIKLPEYYLNDNWVRFSSIGRPHAMPGWTLAIGGVYTEWVSGGQPISGLGLEQYISGLCQLTASVERKYFVSPDGTPHLLLDWDTHGLPMYTSALEMQYPVNVFCNNTCTAEGNSYPVCFPKNRYNDEATGQLFSHIWHSIDGSFYYYLEDRNEVYAKDGTCYQLNPESLQIEKIIDPAGNQIAILVSTPGQHEGPVVVTYTSSMGASMQIQYQRKKLSDRDDYSNPVDLFIDLLAGVSYTGVNGKLVEWTVENENLINHLHSLDKINASSNILRFSDIFFHTEYQCFIEGGVPDPRPIQGDVRDKIFCMLGDPDTTATGNRQIFVLTAINLPGERTYRFEYNRAGKIQRIIYPDGGYRIYEYGNTFDPSTFDLCTNESWVGAAQLGESAYGGVSLVWQNQMDGDGEQLERAYAYSGYIPIENPGDSYYHETLVWTSDGTQQSCPGHGSVQLYKYQGPESMTEHQNLIQYGFSSWKTGKLLKSQSFDFNGSSYSSQTDFEAAFLNITTSGNPGVMPAAFLEMKGQLGIDPASPSRRLLKEEETYYANNDQGWKRIASDLPDGNCSTCAPGVYSVRLFFSGIAPLSAAEWDTEFPYNYKDLYFPEWNTVISDKVGRVYDPAGGSVPIVTRTHYKWGSVTVNGRSEANAQLEEELEYASDIPRIPYDPAECEGASDVPLRKKTYTYWNYWPSTVVNGLPARLLGLPTETKLLDSNGTCDPNDDLVMSDSKIIYPTGTVDDRTHFQPAQTLSLVESGRWTQTDYEYILRQLANPADKAVQLKKVITLDRNSIINWVIYDYDASGFLCRLQAYDPAKPNAVLAMYLDPDPATGLLRRRMDKNGDCNGDGLFTPGTDDYVTFQYDDMDRILGTFLQHDGANIPITSYLYGCQPFTVTRTDFGDDAQNSHVTTTRNDAMGRVAHTWVTSGLKGNTAQESYVTKSFDLLGRVKKEALPELLPAVESSCSHEDSTPTTAINYDYDALGRVIKTTFPSPFGAGGTDYTVENAFSMQTDHEGQLRHTEKVTETVDGELRWRKLWKDGFGRITRVDEQNAAGDMPQPDGSLGEWMTLYTYDCMDRLTQVEKRPDPTSQAPPMIQVRTFSYNNAGWLTSARLPEYDHDAMSYAYDDLGNVTGKELRRTATNEVVYGEGMSYDPFGRLQIRSTTLDRLDGSAPEHITYEYDYDSVRAGVQPPAGYPGTYTWGRPVRDMVVYGPETSSVRIERFFRYNWQGLPEGKADRFATVNSQGQVLNTETFETSYSYDQSGNLTSMTHPSGLTTQYGYGTGGAMNSIMVNGATIFSDIEYAAHGAAAKMVVHDPTERTRTVNWVQTFNVRNWPEKILVGPGVEASYAPNNASVLFGLQYPSQLNDPVKGYENNGNIRHVKRFLRETAGAAESLWESDYGYDHLNRLTEFVLSRNQSVAGTYEYLMDEFGNVTKQQATLEDPALPATVEMDVSRDSNRLGSVTVGGETKSILYDGLGNQTSQTDPSGQALKLDYMDQGHILTVKNNSGTVLYRYYYDADGKRRIKAKAVGGTTSITDNCSYSFYEGEDLVCQQDRGELIVDDDLGHPNADYYGTKYLLLDHLGSTRAELEFADVSGSIVPKIIQSYDLMPQGDLIDRGIEPPDPVLFTGKLFSQDTGLNEFNFRFHNGISNRWMSPDLLFAHSQRIVSPVSWNLYSYVSNSPIRYVDLLGLTEYDQPTITISVESRESWSDRMRAIVEKEQESIEQANEWNKATNVKLAQHYAYHSGTQQLGKGFVFAPNFGITGSAGVAIIWGGIIHFEGNLTPEINLSSPLESRLVFQGQIALLEYGFGAIAAAGLQRGFSVSNSPTPGGVSDQFTTLHAEGGVAWRARGAGWSGDLGYNEKGITSLSASKGTSTKWIRSAGFGAYLGFGNAVNRTWGSPTIRECLDWLKSAF